MTSHLQEHSWHMENTIVQAQIKTEAQPSSATSYCRPLGAVLVKIDTKDAYRLRFQHSTYAQKAKEIIFPMHWSHIKFHHN